MSTQWFAIIHGASRTRFRHLFATSADHPVLAGVTTACSVDVHERFPEGVLFAILEEAERCAACVQKEQEWSDRGFSATNQVT